MSRKPTTPRGNSQTSPRSGFPAFSAVSAATALVLAGAVWYFYAHSHPALDPRACGGCNVLLVTIDTLRIDRVGAYGSTRGLTPTLDRLSDEGLHLTRAYASAPLTLPSHASILTAVPPPVHGLRANGLFRLGPGLPTLATVLKSAGYRTGAFVGAFVLDARFGLDRGFDVYDDRYGEKHAGDPTEGAERRAEQVVTPALAWIRDGVASTSALSTPAPVTPASGTPAPSAPAPGTPASGTPAPSTPAPGTSAPDHATRVSPWFAWVHLYDPHEPYDAPEPFASRYEPYDAEVAYADSQVGRLLDALRAAGQLDRTLVVVAADHGESLGEHGERTHGVFVYDVTTRVPVIVWAGDRVRRASSDILARLIDLAPTVLDLVGVAAPAGFEGRSLVGAISGREAAPASAYLEAMDANLTRNWAPLTGIVSGGNKLIDLPIPELYDLAADPHEAANLYTREPERARTLASLLSSAVAQFAARGSGAERTALGADARQRLQALGYVASSADPARRVYGDADDPKSLIGVSNDLNDAVKAFNAGDRAAAIGRARAIVQSHPNFSTAYGELAAMLRSSGDLSGAIETLDASARRGVADPRSLVMLAGYLTEAGRLDAASAVAEAVIAGHPDFVDAYNSLGVVAMRRGQHDRARAAFRKVLEIDPTSSTAYANLAADYLSAHDLASAIPALEQAVSLDPRNYDALYNLGMALDASGRRAEARPYLQRFVAEAPRPRYEADAAQVAGVLRRP